MTNYLPLLGFDTETTGVSTERDRIVTAALVRRADDGATTERTWLIDPGVEIPERASAVHGITTEYAREHGRPPGEALEEIAAALVAEPGLPIVAFNASYDLAILDADLRRHGLATLAERLGRAVGPVIDPLVLDRAVDRYRRGPRKLGDLVVHYRVEVGGDLHDAMVDVRSTIGVLDVILAAHPHLWDMPLSELHDWQVAKQRAWAEHFNQWLTSKGKPADVSLTWP
ncbi:MAG: exonuclease domain-containing protein [Micrococcales bacterium]|nr:exonuclease domain-containing protein [Micrococcales bacterium]